MVKSVLMICFAPILALAQALEFELQPGAFPAEVGGISIFQPWAGAMKNTTPEFCDIDGDGDLDFFSGSYAYFWFFENSGTSVIPQFVYISSYFDSIACLGGEGSLYEPNIIFADMDNDGDQDAVTSVQILGISWNEGNAIQRNFSGSVDTLFDITGQPIGTVRFGLADIDADGDLDLFTEDWSPAALRFWENVGTPENYTFQLISSNWQNLQVTDGSPSPCFADLDTDGDLDLLVGTGAGTVYYYRNDGTAQNAQMIYVTNNYFNIDVGEDASPELADIDGDGDLDLFVGRSPQSSASQATKGDVYFYLNQGGPQSADFQFVTFNYLTFDNGKYSMPRLVDIDADGDPDLINRQGYGLTLWRNQGTLQAPLFVFETDSFGGVYVPTIIPWFCDIDGDADYDLFCGSGSIPGPPGLYLFLNQGTPQVPSYVFFSDDLVPGVFNQSSVVLSPGTADIDADGDADLFVSDDNGLFYYFQNTGTPEQFQFQYVTSNWQGIADPGWGGHRFFCFWDIDDDSDFDLFIHNWSVPGLSFYRNQGTAQSADMQLESEDFFPNFMIYQAAPFLIDMDQDSDGDMFVGDTWGGIRYFKNVTGDTSAVGPPPVYRHPQAGLQISLGPNPANPFVVASFELRVASNMSLDVFDLLGRRVAELASGFHLPGEYRYVWDAGNRAAGMYIVRLRAGDERVIEKVVLLK